MSGTIHTTKRDIKAENFFVDLFETALEVDEIIESFDISDSVLNNLESSYRL